MSYYPKKINIGFQEGSCPLKCKKCFAFGEGAKQTKNFRKMELYKAKQLIDEIANIDRENRPFIQPYIYAEPFANKELKEIFCYCQEKEVLMTFITNGILIDEEWIDYLTTEFQGETTISFSLDAVTQDTYEKVRGNYELSKIEDTILRLINERKNKRLRIGVNFTIEKENEEESILFFEKWKKIADVVKFGICVDESKQLNKEVRRVFEFAEEPTGEYGCCFLNDIMYIDAGGEVRACGYDAFGESYLGNVFESGIAGVWNGEKLKGLRERVKQRKLSQEEFCYGCKIQGFQGDYITEENDEFIIVKNSSLIYFNKKDNFKKNNY